MTRISAQLSLKLSLKLAYGLGVWICFLGAASEAVTSARPLLPRLGPRRLPGRCCRI